MAAPLRLVPPPSPSGEREGPVTFDALFERYSRYIAGVATHLLGRDDDEIEDVVQDVFWIAAKGLARIHGMEAARPWLVTVTVRVVRRKLRRRRWRKFLRIDRVPEEIVAPGASPSDRVALGQLYRTLDQLAEDERIAWVLRNVEGERLEDVAKACGVSLATAKRKIASAQAVIDEVFRDG